MKNLKKEETVIEGTGGPIYTKPLVKLGDLLARAKDMRNIKQATIVTPKAETQIVMKKEEVEQIDEGMSPKDASNKATIKSMIAKKEDNNQDSDNQYDSHKDAALAHKIARDKYEKGSKEYNDHDKQHKHHLEVIGEESIKETMMSKAAGALAAEEFVFEGLEQIDEVTYSVKDKFKHSENGHIQLSQQAHTGPDAKDQIWHVTHETFKLDTKNPRRGGDFHSKTLHSFNGEDAEKQAREKFGELKDKHAVKSESVDQIDELSNKLLKKYDDAVEKKHTVREPSDPNNKYSGTSTTTYPNDRIATNRIIGAIRSSKRQAGFKGNTDKVSRAVHYKAVRGEEVSIDETATLDKYIRSMGYDPQHLNKNKKVMFAKTNAYKTFASSQKTEGLYDGGQKGTQDIDTHMSPGATARG
jgi:hypothetical protein